MPFSEKGQDAIGVLHIGGFAMAIRICRRRIAKHQQRQALIVFANHRDHRGARSRKIDTLHIDPNGKVGEARQQALDLIAEWADERAVVPLGIGETGFDQIELVLGQGDIFLLAEMKQQPSRIRTAAERGFGAQVLGRPGGLAWDCSTASADTFQRSSVWA